jgi:hypothetical protein
MTVGNASSRVPMASGFMAPRAIRERSSSHCNRAQAPRCPYAIAAAQAATSCNRVAKMDGRPANAHKAGATFFEPTANACKLVVTPGVWTANAHKAVATFLESTANAHKAVDLFFGRAASRQHHEISLDVRFSLLFVDAFQ